MSLYVGASGLMWENAPEFKALLVFAEHRFYGESLPFGAPDKRREFLRQDRASAGCIFVILVGQREALGHRAFVLSLFLSLRTKSSDMQSCRWISHFSAAIRTPWELRNPRIGEA